MNISSQNSMSKSKNQFSPQNPQNEEALLNMFLNKLFHCVNPLVPDTQNLSQNSLIFYKRILSANFNLIENDEEKIVNLLLDLVAKVTNSNFEKLNRFQNLYTKLTKLQSISKRWAALYILLIIGKDKYSMANPLYSQQNYLFNQTINMDPSFNLNAGDISTNPNTVNFNRLTTQQNKFSSNILLPNSLNPQNISNTLPNNANINDNIDYIYHILNDNLNSLNSNNNNFPATNLNKKPEIKPKNLLNPEKTNDIITEADLINDLLFCFEGIDSKFIFFNSEKDCYELNSAFPWDENIYDIFDNLQELGWLYKKIKSFLDFFSESNIQSQFIQSFTYAINAELNEHYKLVSHFRTKSENKDPNFTLENLYLWTMDPKEKLKWLAIACEAVYSLRGASILSQIYSFVNTSRVKYLEPILKNINKPFYQFITNWIKYGELNDPFKEFFVNIREKVDDDDSWSMGYEINYKNIPLFLSKKLTVKIFEIGKIINFLKRYCGLSTFSLQEIAKILKEKIDEVEITGTKSREEEIINEESGKKSNISNILPTTSDKKNTQKNSLERAENADFVDLESYKTCLTFLNNLFSPEITANRNTESEDTQDFLLNLSHHIELIHNLINKILLDVFYTKFNFLENLKSINRYLLLGQGDMMQILMESLYAELSKGAQGIFKHNLTAKLESAIRSSNAHLNDSECLKKLNVKLLNPASGDSGWDIFLLEYNIEVPLNVIFTSNLMRKYQKLFFFFWEFKRVEYLQENAWKKFMHYAHLFKDSYSNLRKTLHKSMLFNQQITHFITNLHNFLALEVLKTQFQNFFADFQNIKNLDELIALHKKFVNDITEQSLLDESSRALHKNIKEIFDLSFRFHTALDVLCSNLYMTEQFSDASQMDNNYKPLKRATEQINELFEEFKAKMTSLLNTIMVFGNGKLRFLAMRLDFNFYYTTLEKENENKKHQELLMKYEEQNKQKRFKANESSNSGHNINTNRYQNLDNNMSDNSEAGNDAGEEEMEDEEHSGGLNNLSNEPNPQLTYTYNNNNNMEDEEDPQPQQFSNTLYIKSQGHGAFKKTNNN